MNQPRRLQFQRRSNPTQRRNLSSHGYLCGWSKLFLTPRMERWFRSRDLRRSMDFQNVEKSSFDQAVLRLADQGKVALHRHDFPAGLSTEDCAELVTDATGDFYVGIALRQ